jgi:hypothetical protein
VGSVGDSLPASIPIVGRPRPPGQLRPQVVSVMWPLPVPFSIFCICIYQCFRRRSDHIRRFVAPVLAGLGGISSGLEPYRPQYWRRSSRRIRRAAEFWLRRRRGPMGSTAGRGFGGALLLDLLGPPGRCSGCWPHDGEVAGGAVAGSTLVISGSGRWPRRSQVRGQVGDAPIATAGRGVTGWVDSA